MTNNLQQRLHRELTASEDQKARIFSSMKQSIAPKQTLWSEVRDFLSPPADTSIVLWQQIKDRLQEAPRSSFGWRIAKWSTAFVLIAAVVKVSPVFFLAPTTTANDGVMLIATDDVIYHSDSGFKTLEKGGQILLTKATQISSDGSFSILWLNGEGVIRGKNADIVVQDLASRKTSSNQSTVKLLEGDLWVQGLVLDNDNNSPFSVQVNENLVTVHDGSVAINTESVAVHDRRATIYGKNTITTLAYHQSLILADNTVNTLSTAEKNAEDVLEQLKKDAVHKNEIALRLQEHFQANVGITHDSGAHFLKRVAEEVDEFLTFDREAKLQKQAQQAQNRYVEAGVLLADNQADKAMESLQEYQERLIALQQDSPEGEQLASEQLAANANTVANVLPSDTTLYPLKDALLDASTIEGSLSADDVHKIKLIDDLEEFTIAVKEQQDETILQKQWVALKDRLPQPIDKKAKEDELETEAVVFEKELTPTEEEAVLFEQDVQSILTDVALTVKENSDEGKRNTLLESLEEVAQINLEEPEPTEEQKQAEVIVKTKTVADTLLENMKVYSEPNSQVNQLLLDLREQDYSPEAKGRILKEIDRILAEEPDSQKVRAGIRKEMINNQ